MDELKSEYFFRLAFDCLRIYTIKISRTILRQYLGDDEIRLVDMVKVPIDRILREQESGEG